MRNRILWMLLLPLVLVGTSVSPSWARWHGGWGFRGPRVGVYLGPWPYYDGYSDPYYYDSYYPYDYPTYPSYYYPPEEVQPNEPSQEEQETSAPDNSHHDLKTVCRALAKARNRANFSLDDGDITQTQRDQEIQRLKDIAKEAQSEFDANGGYLTGDQQSAILDDIQGIPRQARTPAPEQEETSAPSKENTHLSSRRNPSTVLRLVKDLHETLNKKLSGTAITEAQHDEMSKRLDRIAQEAKSEASANGGYLTADQENALLLQLDHDEDAIDKNFVLP